MGSLSVRQQILEVNADFYAAFNARDLAAMGACWAVADDVASIPPIGDPAIGWTQVMGAFEDAFAQHEPFTISTEVLSVTFDDPVATVSCAEVLVCEGADGSRHDMLATNVFVLGQDGWRLTHHHASWRASVVTESLADPAAPAH